MGLDIFPSRTNATVAYGDSANLDAFSRLRVSQPTGLFEVQCQYNTQPLLIETGVTGTGVAGAHDANTRMVALACTAGAVRDNGTLSLYVTGIGGTSATRALFNFSELR